MADTGPFSKRWEDLTFADNYIFCEVMKDDELCKELLEILLHIKIERLERPEPEKMLQPNYPGKGVRLDVYVKDTDRVFDIEMQTGNYDDLLLRGRYYQSVMDISETKHRTKYRDLKETYIIFICKDDPFKMGCSSYTKESHFKECPDLLINDKSHFIVYNASGYKNEQDGEIRAVLKFIYGLKAESSFTNKIDSTVNRMKEDTDDGGHYMFFSDILEDEKDEAREAGIEEGKLETAKNMLKIGKLSQEEIAQYSGLSLEKVKELSNEVCITVSK